MSRRTSRCSGCSPRREKRTIVLWCARWGGSGRRIDYNRPMPIPGDQPQSQPHPLPTRIARSFYYAFAGLFFLFRTQRNARIELALGLAACGVGAWVHITRVEWAIIAFTIALVLILEG